MRRVCVCVCEEDIYDCADLWMCVWVDTTYALAWVYGYDGRAYVRNGYGRMYMFYWHMRSECAGVGCGLMRVL